MRKIESTLEYNKKIAKNFHDIRYYDANQFYIKEMKFIDEEKKRLKTENKPIVTKKIKDIIQGKIEFSNKVFIILKKIYKKNEDYIFKKKDKILGTKEPLNSDLFTLISNKDLLMTSYQKIRKNKGANTKAADMKTTKYEQLNSEQKSFINKVFDFPDGINEKVFYNLNKLIRKNKYPWGCSKRIYVDKPGKKDTKRPITIPPFIDKVVQEATTSVLQSIYEPYFEKLNCSFGFRPNKGVHDAIIALTSAKAQGMTTALEGDIKSAYDKVNKKKLIEILEEKIKDKKLLKFIEKRLEYDIYDKEKKGYIQEKSGVPQGGIDSPYLWNIYMSVFDEWIIQHITKKFKEINLKVRKNENKKNRSIDTRKRSLTRTKSTIKSILIWINSKRKEQNVVEQLQAMIKNKTAKQIKEEKIMEGEILGLKDILKKAGLGKEKDIKKIIKNLFIMSKQVTHNIHKLPTLDQNKLILKFIYVRYADDFIIITNAKRKLMEIIKIEISDFLRDELYSELSLEKTIITELKKEPARFLGYEIKTYKKKKIARYKWKNGVSGKSKIIKATVAGSKVFATPDKQRLINKLHMKGYCEKNGFPREIGFLSYLEDFAIIERYNSVLTGLANYYVEFIKNPEKNLSRWFYIISYSCIKTLAQKHKLTVKGVFKKYGTKIQIGNKYYKTISTSVITKIDDNVYEKTWHLQTRQELIDKARSQKLRVKLNDYYWILEQGIPVVYEKEDGKRITSDNYLEKLTWVNIRTQSSFELPCAICGAEENIQMHHINHVRKNKYSLIDKEQTWTQAMSLRNRRQIPVCQECHTTLIHRGSYGGQKLSHLAPKIMFDNRIITIESSLNKKARWTFNPKNLTDKGWILKQN